MPRGQRKSVLERLQEELQDVRDSIKQYENCLVTMRTKEKELAEQVGLEEYKELSALLNEQGMSVADLKDMIQEKALENEKQSA